MCVSSDFFAYLTLIMPTIHEINKQINKQTKKQIINRTLEKISLHFTKVMSIINNCICHTITLCMKVL